MDKQRLLSRLAKLQEEMRAKMIADLDEEGDELDEIFSPDSFSNKYELYRYKHTERLDTLNRIIGEVQRSDGARPTFKASSVEAGSLSDLTALITQRFAKLRPAAVADVKVVHDRGRNVWVAVLICGY
ncbi:hypothetical protein HQ560_10635 [bacterium]|nr:hypothetical protein [bacterium]